MLTSALCQQAFSVLTIYYIWRIYLQSRLRRERTLRERLTYMLWVMVDSAA
jgi:hypothetical protein